MLTHFGPTGDEPRKCSFHKFWVTVETWIKTRHWLYGCRQAGDACIHFPLTGFYKGILRRFWHTRGFINLKTFVHMHTFKMKCTQSFTSRSLWFSFAFFPLNVCFPILSDLSKAHCSDCDWKGYMVLTRFLVSKSEWYNYSIKPWV